MYSVCMAVLTLSKSSQVTLWRIQYFWIPMGQNRPPSWDSRKWHLSVDVKTKLSIPYNIVKLTRISICSGICTLFFIGNSILHLSLESQAEG